MGQDLADLLTRSSSLGPAEVLGRFFLALLLSVMIAAIYARTYRGYGRPSQLAVVLVMVAIATAGIIMAIGDNLALSLGMVGALSIVRFRAAVKDNRDLAYVFWTLAVGLVSGAGAYLLAILLLVFMGVAVGILERLDLFETTTRKYIVILSTTRGAEGPAPGDLIPVGAQLRGTVFHAETGVEETTYLVDFADPDAIARFQSAAAAAAGVRSYQILGPEEAILG